MITVGDKRYSWTRQRMLIEIERLDNKVQSLKTDKAIHKKLGEINKRLKKLERK